MAEGESKPFKTIEVIDRHTGQPCKVACMSCIRGHRTTSCGIPVCRSKVFWTVKRPGRPSNSCTCRYGATGGCRCVTAKIVCPHKAKKGEKRPGECRCEEQGRFCCLLEQDDWKALMAMQKPQVDFFPTKEDLENRQNLPTPITMPSTPFTFPGSPHASQNGSSRNGTPGPQPRQTPINIVPSPYENLLPQRQASITPRFGMMGLGAPQGSESSTVSDPMAWDFQSPHGTTDFVPSQDGFQQHQPQQSKQSSCCQSAATTPGPQLPRSDFFSPSPQNFQTAHPQQPPASSCCQSGTQPQPNPLFTFDDPQSPIPTIPGYQQYPNPPPQQPFQPAPFDYDRLISNYNRYQYPNAICQKCGLNGCTCSNCPPTMQNFATGSWAQCCGRTHAMVPQSTAFAPPPQMLPPMQSQNGLVNDHGLELGHEHGPGGDGDLQMQGAGTEYSNEIFDSQHQLHEPLGLPELQRTMEGYQQFGGADENLLFGTARTPDGSGGCCVSGRNVANGAVSGNGVVGSDAEALAFSELLMGELDRPT